MQDSLMLFLVYLLTLAINASSVSHRLQPIRSNQYRKAITKVLVNECNSNRLLMLQIDDDSNEFANFETTFSCRRYPDPVSIQDYINRMYNTLHFAGMPNNDGIFVLVTLYIDRLMKRSSMKVTYWNVHRILSMSMWMACKMQYDLLLNIKIIAPNSFGLEDEGMNFRPSL